MRLKVLLTNGIALLLVATAARAGAQEDPAKRLANIVGVAVGEYAKGIDEHGRLISDQEYQETVGFIADADSVAARLTGANAAAVRAVLDTLTSAVRRKLPPSEIASIGARFARAIGSASQLDLPTAPLSLANGRQVYQTYCERCHGERGLGDGPDAKSVTPVPAPIGVEKEMADASPELQYRVVSAGVAGTQMPAWGSVLTPQQRWDVLTYVQSMRSTAADVLEGQGLYVQWCAACHAVPGSGAHAATAGLATLPPEITSFEWQATHSDVQMAAAIRDGVAGSPMPPARALTDDDIRHVVAYLRTVPVTQGEVPQVAKADTGIAGAAQRVTATLDEALAAAQAGRRSDAGDRAFDAYIAFEPLETPARAKSPGLVSAMEKRFADFKAAIRTDDLQGARNQRDAIVATLPAVVELTQRTSGGWAAFLQSFLIILREGFEAILVIGAVVAFLIKTGHRERLRSIWVGSALGVVASALTAVVLQTVLRAFPASQDLLEGISMLVAVVVLFMVSYWLISKVEAAKWQQFIREKVTRALEHGGGSALAFVAFLAVYREGAEVALFYQALFGEGPGLLAPLTLGIVVGGVALAVIFTLFYRYGVRIPLRPFFAATSALLYFMAFVFAGRGIRELQEVNVVPFTVLHGFPQIEAIGIFPTLETLGAQVVLVVLFVLALVKTFWPRRSVALPMIDSTSAAPEQAMELTHLVERLESRLAALENAAADAASEAAELLTPDDRGAR